MDGSTIDALARLAAISRRGAATSALLAAQAALGFRFPPAGDPAAGKKRRKRKRKNKKRCLRLRAACNSDGKKTCCHDLSCAVVPETAGLVCCKKPGAPCEDGQDCCGDLECGQLQGLTGNRCCAGVGSSCANDTDCCGNQSFCNEGACAPCPFACATGERCIHGTCTCDAFDNACPDEVDGQCSCGGRTVDGDGPICADKLDACDQDTPCTTNDDCPVGSVCKTTCVDPGNPQPNRCSNPCIPV